MATYLYETLEGPYLQFEARQSMKDEPLQTHPQTGVPVRRVITGGFGLLQKAAAPSSHASRRGGGCCCGGACGCGH